jgi:hypothetical protein
MSAVRVTVKLSAWSLRALLCALLCANGCNLIGYDRRGPSQQVDRDGGGTTDEQDAATMQRDGGAELDAADALDGAADDHELTFDAEAGTLNSDAAVTCTDPMRCNYECPKGASDCELQCIDSRECISKCTANAHCRTTCQGAEHCHMDCPAYSSCEVICRGSAECQPHCADNSICHVTCIDNDCRGVKCDAKADCTLTCLGTSNCVFKKCSNPQCVGEQTMYCGGSHSCVAP